MIPKLDKLDYSILINIQNNAKITNLQLSETIGLSPASTLERVKRLETQGIIKSYHAQLDRYKLAIHLNLWLQICLHDLAQETIKNFKQALDQLPEVVACYQVVGEVDFLLSVLTTDMIAYQNILVNKLSGIKSIKSIKTMIVLSTLKETGIPIIPLGHF
ncbi:MAG: hypothetical protein BGO68_03310 [Candidatus Amoebophilus sp. 36-38]|nr:MAG: hypothetical protein BGO68_03310 [Candidatus Amoebophilus sp. 36-38]